MCDGNSEGLLRGSERGSAAGMRIGRRVVYFSDREFAGKALVVVIPDLDAVVHIELRETQDVVGIGTSGKAKTIGGRFAQSLKNGETLFAARLDDSLDTDDLKAVGVGPNTANEKTLTHTLGVGLLNRRDVKRKNIS